MTSQMTDILLAEAASNAIPESPPRCDSAAPSLTFSELTLDDSDESRNSQTRKRRASTRLVAQNPQDIQRITGESTTELIKRCCGGGCCFGNPAAATDDIEYESITVPDNEAFRSLQLKLKKVSKKFTNTTALPEQTVFIEPLRRPSSVPSPTQSSIPPDSTAPEPSKPADTLIPISETVTGPGRSANVATTLQPVDTSIQPPLFVQPHPPYHVYPARIHSARELTNPGAEKRTFHLDLDVTDYPIEDGVDFRVGGAIGVTAPNDPSMVDEVLDLLLVPRFLRSKPCLLRTTQGRWPTVWGEEQPRELITTRRDLLTWCSDIQSYPPTKPFLRLMAEYATDINEKKILTFICSGEGQGVFCDMRTGPHLTLIQLLHAFPSSKPPLGALLSVLQPLMPRFYSLSNDPLDSWSKDGTRRRLVEIAVSVYETPDWRSNRRTGIGSGFLERKAREFIQAVARGEEPQIYVPIFKGLMANPLAKQFNSDGPMLLIGAGVGVAPFRGFVQRRLKSANCVNKVWVLQGIRDLLVDELYRGEWGIDEQKLKKVVESRRGTGHYVQEEVRNQADLVWFIINSLDGRVFVCGSSKGMGEGVENALVEVAMQKGNLQRDEAQKFWDLKKEAGQYIAETW